MLGSGLCSQMLHMHMRTLLPPCPFGSSTQDGSPQGQPGRSGLANLQNCEKSVPDHCSLCKVFCSSNMKQVRRWKGECVFPQVSPRTWLIQAGCLAHALSKRVCSFLILCKGIMLENLTGSFHVTIQKRCISLPLGPVMWFQMRIPRLGGVCTQELLCEDDCGLHTCTQVGLCNKCLVCFLGAEQEQLLQTCNINRNSSLLPMMFLITSSYPK